VRLSFCAIALALSGALPLPAHAEAQEDQRATLFAETDEIFTAFAREHHIPGLVYGIVAEGRLLHVGSIGVADRRTKRPITPSTIFRIASLTKAFTALGVLELRDSGAVDLEADIASYISDLHLIYPNSDRSAIRVRDLLTHTGGFITDDPWADRQLAMPEAAFTAAIEKGLSLARPPRSQFDYSNLGYALLGRIISRASGESYQQYLKRTILRPLGMGATEWDVASVPEHLRAKGYSWNGTVYSDEPALTDGAFGAMAGLHTSATDYAKYVTWMLSAWTPNAFRPSAILSKSTLREAASPAVYVRQQLRERDGEAACPTSWMYGFGLYVVEDCEFGTMLRHPGGLPGYGSQLVMLPDKGIGVFAFANLTYAPVYKPSLTVAAKLVNSHLFALPAEAIRSDAVAAASQLVIDIYRAGDVRVGRHAFASNLLLDRPAFERNAELKAHRRLLGRCSGPEKRDAPSALSVRLELVCDRGRLRAAVLLASTRPETIQYLSFEAVPDAKSAARSKRRAFNAREAKF
jgi:D-alanyl-D-alanine-carboxypeptidase/D-alanyl-D-alanine-endopeptidase